MAIPTANSLILIRDDAHSKIGQKVELGPGSMAGYLLLPHLKGSPAQAQLLLLHLLSQAGLNAAPQLSL